MTDIAKPMTTSGDARAPAGAPRVTPIPASWVARMLATASRAPSVHNTQPWRFSVTVHAIELYADPARKVHQDAIGRQMLISCGAALFGLRLAVRELGRVPAVTLLPDPARPALLARVTLGLEAPATELERRMLAALPHRHTHRRLRPGDPARTPAPRPAARCPRRGCQAGPHPGAGRLRETGRARGRSSEEAGREPGGPRGDPALEPGARKPPPRWCARERVRPGGRDRARPAGTARFRSRPPGRAAARTQPRRTAPGRYRGATRASSCSARAAAPTCRTCRSAVSRTGCCTWPGGPCSSCPGRQSRRRRSRCRMPQRPRPPKEPVM